ncbi:CMP-N-acetylneuraminate-beta-galactosamide-alpha-2,3-sialyltransferase 1 [Channa argus]|uniref:CMP-N-acetylneuraminate-beta-galactosamide-alpha-2,3-sialyltransferase 1 n=2 Tax=Channa argus TaxID=215402 RepID=A0A6G1QZU3_CHAAH|nr:CMP-N-acetylneuraminate-beta-galactosamide-alpha-2,3-sialyltransferase 1 [Channa argus]
MSKWRVLIFLLCVFSITVLFKENDQRRILQKFNLPLDTDPFACGKCLTENDTWFLQRINQSVKPFLSPNHNLSEDTFNWWKLLQKEKRNFSHYKETVDMLFQIFPSIPDVIESRPQKYESCAVVGNSANLIRSHYGPLIDFHDVVIRINAGQTKGYETDVGNKTTHRIMYPESATDLDNTTHLVLFPFKIQDLEWLISALTTGFSGKWYLPIKSKIKANKNLVMVMNPAFMKYVHDAWLENKGNYPSTGFMALLLALHICDEVHVFGYGADKDGNWSHYWEKLKDTNLKTGMHPGIEEYQTIEKLAQKMKLTFYRGL